MHPNPAFRDDGDLLARAGELGFAHLFVAGDTPVVVHAPVTCHDDRLRFHIARSNRAAAMLDGATVIASIAGAESYVSPGWYGVPGNQVPTWNYEAIEIEGRCVMLDEARLVEQLDALATMHEPRVNPLAPWTRGKMDADVFARMLRSIVGFELVVSAIRGTRKHSQNKPAADRAGVIAGLRATGHSPLADAMAAT